ncbi:predicted protein [Coccidioides posadasii str. Silveira]|uniref:Predicted protein n=1 Tax=Coccidioides posadasii (strain RMSCC 757 / Silveira) TaxID=443226 RepID=E9D910_COCPS|nr:predicted protein [Coccidioides posadasii str. Silveira]
MPITAGKSQETASVWRCGEMRHNHTSSWPSDGKIGRSGWEENATFASSHRANSIVHLLRRESLPCLGQHTKTPLHQKLEQQDARRAPGRHSRGQCGVVLSNPDSWSTNVSDSGSSFVLFPSARCIFKWKAGDPKLASNYLYSTTGQNITVPMSPKFDFETGEQSTG